MPVYQYQCEEHGSFERIKKISEREQAECPECGEICSMQITAPKMLQGGYMDKSMKFSKGV